MVCDGVEGKNESSQGSSFLKPNHEKEKVNPGHELVGGFKKFERALINANRNSIRFVEERAS